MKRRPTSSVFVSDAELRPPFLARFLRKASRRISPLHFLLVSFDASRSRVDAPRGQAAEPRDTVSLRDFDEEAAA